MFEDLEIGPVDHVEYKEEKRREEEKESVHIVVSAKYNDDLKIMYDEYWLYWPYEDFLNISWYEIKNKLIMMIESQFFFWYSLSITESQSGVSVT